VQPSSPAYVIISFVTNYVAVICAVFATGEPMFVSLSVQPLIDIASLEHGRLTRSLIYTRPYPSRAQRNAVSELQRADPWSSNGHDRLGH
jgi:hypothetical protein